MKIIIWLKILFGLVFVTAGMLLVYTPAFVGKLVKIVKATILNESILMLKNRKIGFVLLLLGFVLLYMGMSRLP